MSRARLDRATSKVGEGASGGVDLFDVRFAENELLFYTRDESPLLDARRDLTLVIDRPAALRHKLAALEAQTLVLAEALALTLQADLLRVFGPAGSRVRLVWRCDTDDDRAAAAEERALLAIPLASEVAHRRVELVTVDAWADVPGGARVVLSPLAQETDVPCAAWVRAIVARSCWKYAPQCSPTSAMLRRSTRLSLIAGIAPAAKPITSSRPSHASARSARSTSARPA